MNALADARVGKYLSENFVSAFQKVGTFRIVGQQKQGGNVASYFCAQDGRVLHVVAGPVDANTLLREAHWVVDNVKRALKESKDSGTSFKAQFRTAHAQRLRKEFGLAVEPVTYDTPPANGALSYRDPTGKALAPVLPPPPIEGPDVGVTEQQRKALEAPAAGGGEGQGPGAARRVVTDIRGRRWALNNQGQVHVLLAAHAMKKIETIYGTVFEGILGEKVSTMPVMVQNPFPWRGQGGLELQLR